MISFELAGGSVIGRDHRVVPKNNQDAYHVYQGIAGTVAVVCDGCGSGAHSEVGAAIGARLICRSVHDELMAHGQMDFRWWRVERDVLSSVHVLATQMGGNYRETIEDYFLFTIIGVVIPTHPVSQWGSTPTVVFFGVGDGLTVINGESNWSGPWPGNAPPYLAYQLLDAPGFAPSELELKATHTIPDHLLESFLIGCDGAAVPGLTEVCSRNPNLPGMKNMEVGPLSQFWSLDCNFTNPVAISRRLKLIARDWPAREPEHGLLADDTTIVVGRRTHD